LAPAQAQYGTPKKSAWADELIKRHVFGKKNNSRWEILSIICTSVMYLKKYFRIVFSTLFSPGVRRLRIQATPASNRRSVVPKNLHLSVPIFWGPRLRGPTHNDIFPSEFSYDNN
jgi:hypothetical protein